MIRKLLFVVALLSLAVIAFRIADEGVVEEVESGESTSPLGQHSIEDPSANGVVLDQGNGRSQHQIALASFHAEQPDGGTASSQTVADRQINLNFREALLKSANTLEQGQALQAKLRYKIDMFGEELNGPGFYIQEGQGSGRWRMELKHQSLESELALTQVCDGRFFYRMQELNGSAELSFVDLNRLPTRRNRNSNVNLGQEFRNPWSTIGGLPSAIKQVATHFEFGKVTAGRLGEIPVYRAVGKLRANSLRRFFANADSSSETSQHSDSKSHPIDMVPPHFPHMVQIVLGTEEDRFPLFPYRVVFYRLDGDSSVSTSNKLRATVVLEFFNLGHAGSVSPKMFEVQSPPDGSTDITDEYVRQGQRLKGLR